MDLTKENILEKLRAIDSLLHPTQSKVCIPILNRIYKKMHNKLLFDSIKVDQELIIDGHHRYLASILSNYKIEIVPSKRTSATVKLSWEDIDFVEEEWDTLEKIKMLNEVDAEYNKIPLEKIVEMLN